MKPLPAALYTDRAKIASSGEPNEQKTSKLEIIFRSIRAGLRHSALVLGAPDLCSFCTRRGVCVCPTCNLDQLIS